MLPQGLINIRN